MAKNEMNLSKFEGDNIINSIVRDIVRNQSKGVAYSQKEKEELFEKGFSSALEKIEQKTKLNKTNNSKTERIKNLFQFKMK